MTDLEKMAMVKAILGPDSPDDDTIMAYLEMAKNEILSWRYSYDLSHIPGEVPTEYEMTQVNAVVYGITQRGAEGQSTIVENGVHRHFNYTDMARYVRGNVVAMAKVGAAP